MIEAKRTGATLAGVESQTLRYRTAFRTGPAAARANSQFRCPSDSPGPTGFFASSSLP